MFNPAPVELSETLSPAWLSEALGQAYPGVVVASVTIVETIVTMATKVRFAVTYDSAPDGTPFEFCLKGLFGEHVARMRASAISKNEVRFYREASPLLAIRTPRVVYSGIAPDGGAVLIMRDEVAAGARFLTALTPYTLDQAASSLDQLAQLHAATWRGRLFEKFPWLTDRISYFVDTPVMTTEKLQAYMDGPRGVPLKPEIRDAARIEKGMAALVGRTPAAEHCMIHGDAHAGNVFEDARGPSLIDWQMVQRSGWALDVAYHLGAVLAPEERAASERRLLDHYMDRLRAHGATPPDREAAWTEYRAHMAYGFFMWAITQKVEPAIVEEFNRRLGLAVTELGSFELLGV